MSQKAKPADALSRFMHGIFSFYRDKGMPVNTAKARMYDETLEACGKMMKQDPDIPDHTLVIASQFLYDLVNQRGIELSKELKKMADVKTDDPRMTALRQLKASKDALNSFISSYKGVS
jgi:hypothetical protein